MQMSEQEVADALLELCAMGVIEACCDPGPVVEGELQGERVRYRIKLDLHESQELQEVETA